MDGAVTPALEERLRERFGERARFGEPLSRHTSFRIGGPADVWVEVTVAEEIVALFDLATTAAVPVLVFGSGTNVLVSDRGIRGIVMKLGRAFAGLEWKANGRGAHVRAGASAPFKRLVTEAAQRGLAGLEFAEGIPGSIGGGLLMNAGAFGGEIAPVVDGVAGVQAGAGTHYLPRAELRFSYRFFELPRGFVVTHVDFLLHSGDPEAIRATMADAKRRREGRQPLGWPNAGSIFKNPPGHFAGKLIEAAGLKGRRVGDAMISDQHANFIVNVGQATAADVKVLMDEMQAAVERQHGVRLMPEVKLLGDWGTV